MLITASIAMLGVSLGGPSALFKPHPVEAVSTSEMPTAFCSAAESPWCCREDITPLDVSTGAYLEQTIRSYSVELLPTEYRLRTGLNEPGDFVLERIHQACDARSADGGLDSAPSALGTPDQMIVPKNGPYAFTRTVVLPYEPFTSRSEPYTGGRAGLATVLVRLNAVCLIGCVDEAEAVGGYVVFFAGAHPGGHDVQSPWGMNTTASTCRTLEAHSSARHITTRPWSCQLLARRGFHTRAGAAWTGYWCDVTSEDQFRPFSDPGGDTALHADEFVLSGMNSRIVMSEEDCIMNSTRMTSVFREAFSEPKGNAGTVTRPSGFAKAAMQLFLAECSSLGAVHGPMHTNWDQVGVDRFPNIDFPNHPIVTPMRAVGDIGGFGSTDGAGLFYCSLGWMR